MIEAGKAVFLSYASQDADAAKKICEALRAAGVEVWFDQSELVGGDAWDQKIRKHIKECTLLIPVISAATQARTEGYFRLEWRLADQRTHLMAKGRPFLLPVVIDDTRDADAHVPDSFTEVQWTRLKGGETPPAFVTRVKKLLGGEVDVARVSRPVISDPIMGRETHATTAKSKPIWLWVLLALVVALPAYCIFKPRRSPEDIARMIQQAQGLAEKMPKPASGESADNAGSKPSAESVLARVRVISAKTDVFRSELDTATSLLEQAAKLEPDNASVWAEWALVDWRYGVEAFDRSPARFDAARRHVAQAVSLDPSRPITRLAQALVMTLLNEDEATQAAAARILEALLPDLPNDGRVPLELGWHTLDREHPEVALGWFDRAAKIPGQAGRAHFGRAITFMMLGSLDRTEAELDLALAAERAPSFLLWKGYVLTIWNGDVAASRRVLQEVPPQMWVEDMPAITRYFIERTGRDYDQALVALRAVPHDYLESAAFSGPAGYFKGDLLALAGKPAAAQLEWRSALDVVERRLAAEPNGQRLMQFKALLLACLGHKAEADQVWKAELELYGDSSGYGTEQLLRMKLLPPDQAFDWVAKKVADSKPIATAARLRLDPAYDPIRSDPRFPALLARAEADPKLSPIAKAQAAISAPAAADDKSVAVLAFANLSDDKGNEYFSDGISEELLTVLQKIPGLHVAARTSSFYFKGKEATAQEIGTKLGVANLVEGSVQKAGSRVKVTARLSRAATGEELWSRSYTRELKDVFALQEELALAIVGELRGQLGGGGDAAAVKAAVQGGTTNPEAYQWYLQGRFHAARNSEKNMGEALAAFQRAVELDPDFALAWAGLGLVHMWSSGFSTEVGQAGFMAHLANARKAADRALTLAPKLPEALLVRALIQLNFDFDWKGAGETLRTALAVAPADSTLLTAAGNLAGAVDDQKRAIELYRQAVALDPVNPLARSFLAYELVMAGKYPEAQAEYARVVELNPAAPWAHAGLGLAFVLQGKFEEAVNAAQDDAAEWARLLIKALAHFGQKRRPEADAALAQLTAKFGDTAAYQIAEVHAYRGERDEAFSWLERAFKQRDSGLVGLRHDPLVANLKDDPRWLVFLRKLNLAADQ